MKRLTLQPLRIGSPANSFGSWRILFEEELCQIRFMCTEKQQQKRWAYEKFISVLTTSLSYGAMELCLQRESWQKKINSKSVGEIFKYFVWVS